MVLVVLFKRLKHQYWRLLGCCQAYFTGVYRLPCHGIALIGTPLIGGVDWQSRRLVVGHGSGSGFGLFGRSEKCY
jgi:hypothetical protein